MEFKGHPQRSRAGGQGVNFWRQTVKMAVNLSLQAAMLIPLLQQISGSNPNLGTPPMINTDQDKTTSTPVRPPSFFLEVHLDQRQSHQSIALAIVVVAVLNIQLMNYFPRKERTGSLLLHRVTSW